MLTRFIDGVAQSQWTVAQTQSVLQASATKNFNYFQVNFKYCWQILKKQASYDYGYDYDYDH